jgi:hypothetical protein
MVRPWVAGTGGDTNARPSLDHPCYQSQAMRRPWEPGFCRSARPRTSSEWDDERPRDDRGHRAGCASAGQWTPRAPRLYPIQCGKSRGQIAAEGCRRRASTLPNEIGPGRGTRRESPAGPAANPSSRILLFREHSTLCYIPDHARASFSADFSWLGHSGEPKSGKSKTGRCTAGATACSLRINTPISAQARRPMTTDRGDPAVRKFW